MILYLSNIIKSTFFKKSSSVFFSIWIANVIRFLIGVYIIREFNSEGKGYIVAITAVPGVLSSILSFGLNNAYVYYLKKGAITLNKVIANFLSILTITVFVFALVLYITKDFFWEYLFSGLQFSRVLYIYLIIYLPVLICLLFIKTYLLAMHEVKGYGVVITLPLVLSSVLTIIITEFVFKSIYVPLFSILFSDLLFAVYYIIKLINSKKISVKSSNNKVKFTEVYYYALRSNIMVIANTIFKKIDVFLIIAYVDAKALGYYSIASFFSQATLSIPKSVNGLLLGTLSENSFKKANSLSIRAFKHMFFIVLLVVIVMVILGHYLIPIIYGTDFIQALVPFYLLQIASLLTGSSSVFQTYFMGIGKPNLPAIILIFSGIIQSVLMWLFVKNMGINGVALSVLIGSFIIFISRYFIYIYFIYINITNKKYE